MTKKHAISFLVIFTVSILCMFAPFVLTGCSGGGGSAGGGTSSAGRNSGADYPVSPDDQSSSGDSAPQAEPELSGNGVLITVSNKDNSRRAVIVGACGYPGGGKELAYAAQDALDFKDALVDEKTWNLADVKIQNNVTKSMIQEAVNDAKNNISDGGLFVFFYSGYGSNANGAGYIMPYENSKNSGSMISDNELKNWFESFPANSKKFILMDSCFNDFSGSFRGIKRDSSTNSKFMKIKGSDNSYSVEKFAETLLQVPNTYIMAAARETENACENSALENGIFTYYLCEGLGGDSSTLGAADSDSGKFMQDSDTPDSAGNITAKELSSYVPAAVDTYTSAVQGDTLGQHSQTYNNCAEDFEIKSLYKYPSPPLWGSDVIITISKPDRSACAVIVSVYGDWVTGRKFAGDDALSFKDALLGNPFWIGADVKYENCNIVTKAQIQTAVANARKKIASNGLFMFVYSGDGANSGGVGYLLPRDSLQNPRKKISEKEIRVWLDSFLYLTKYVIIASGFNGAPVSSENSESGRANKNFSTLEGSGSNYSNDKFGETLAGSPDTYVMMSSSGEESCFEDDRLRNSVFMYYVCEGLGEEGGLMGLADADSNNAVTPEELSLYVSKNVNNHVSKMTGGVSGQNPKVYAKNYRGCFNIKSGAFSEGAGNIIITISKPDNSAYAVLVGMSDYPGKGNDLPYSVNSVECFKAQLLGEASLIGSSSLWKNSRVEIKRNVMATKAEIKKAIASARNNVTKDGLFIFLYNGHGGNGNITTYEFDGDITKEDLKLWLDMFSSQTKKYIVLSSCHAGSFIDKNMKSGDSETEAIFVKEFIPKFDSEMFAKTIVGSPNTYVITECRGDEYGWYDPNLRGTALLYFINYGLCAPIGRAEADLNRDGAVTAEELSAYAAPRVSEYIYNRNIIYEGKRQTSNPQSYDNVPGELRIK